MQWWGPANSLEFIDKPDALTIRAMSIRRRGDLLLPCALALGFILAPWFGGGFFVLAALGIASAASFYGWSITSIVELRVTQRGIEARSSGGCVSAPWSEIKGLEYRVGGENEPGGLYARQARWRGVQLTGQLTETECDEVIAAIFTRFPFVAMAVDDEGGILNFGRSDEIISLGLSRTEK